LFRDWWCHGVEVFAIYRFHGSIGVGWSMGRFMGTLLWIWFFWGSVVILGLGEWNNPNYKTLRILIHSFLYEFNIWASEFRIWVLWKSIGLIFDSFTWVLIWFLNFFFHFIVKRILIFLFVRNLSWLYWFF